MMGCASNHESQVKEIAQQVEKAAMNKTAFCGHHELLSYIETDYYYNWTCSNGFSGMLPKKD